MVSYRRFAWVSRDTQDRHREPYRFWSPFAALKDFFDDRSIRARKAKEFTLLVFFMSSCVILFTVIFRYTFGVFGLTDVSLNPTSARPETRFREPHRLVFYNRPPNTGSASVHLAMTRAAADRNLTSSSCFEGSLWNEMVWKTALRSENVDFHGCRMGMPPDRFHEVARLRAGNVTFMTSTRDPKHMILSSYLEEQGDRDVIAVADPGLIAAEVDSFRAYVRDYPVDTLYSFHGATTELNKCPEKHKHVLAMRDIASRYEVVIDLTKPKESTEMVDVVTGLQPRFSHHRNRHLGDTALPMLAELLKVDTSEKNCGNELVHTVLIQQFNIIKDRLMQNRCFDEATGSSVLCDLVKLEQGKVTERSRLESFREKAHLGEKLETLKQ